MRRLALAVLAITLLCINPAHARRVALVVGATNYANVEQLPNGRRDAEAMAGVLRRLGFSVTPLYDPDEQAFEAALSAFRAEAASADAAVIFFAGHGVGVDNMTYVVPVDARLAHQYDVERETISLDYLMRTVGGANGLRLVILDACRNNRFASRMARPVGQRPRSINRGLARVEPLGDILVWYATRHDDTADDGAGLHSPFTQALLDHIETPGMEIDKLFRTIRDQVWRDTGGDQTPFEYGSRGLRDFYFTAGFAPPRPTPTSPGDLCDLVDEVPMGTECIFEEGRMRFEPIASVSPQPLPPTQRPAQPAAASAAQPTIFRDCDQCPEMVVIPGGSFLMGSPEGEAGRSDNEGPQTPITLGSFALGRYEVIFAEWDACAAAGACRAVPLGDRGDQGWGRERRPVIRVSVEDAEAYIAWLNSQVSGSPYRLPSEAEWEYAARAGSTTAYPWGDRPDRSRANYGAEACCSGEASGADRWEHTAPAGSFPANTFGLHDMIGNVWEWTADCWNASYSGRPRDGGAWRSGDCTANVLRGGSWSNSPRILRAANRYGYGREVRYYGFGFRVARTLR